MNNNNRNFSLSYDQRLMLEMYIGFYNTTQRQLDTLHETQREVRRSIDSIIGVNNTNNVLRRNNREYNSIPVPIPRPNTRPNTNNLYNRYSPPPTNPIPPLSSSRHRRNRNSPRYNNNNTTTPQNINQRHTNNGVPYEHTNERIEINELSYLIDFLRFAGAGAGAGIPRTSQSNNNDYMNILRDFYSNVPVRPTQLQIENSTRNIRFGNIYTID